MSRVHTCSRWDAKKAVDSRMVRVTSLVSLSMENELKVLQTKNCSSESTDRQRLCINYE